MQSLVFVFVWLRCDSIVFRSCRTCCNRRAQKKAALKNTIRVGDATSPLSPITLVCFLGCNFVVHVSYVHEPFSGSPW